MRAKIDAACESWDQGELSGCVNTELAPDISHSTAHEPLACTCHWWLLELILTLSLAPDWTAPCPPPPPPPAKALSQEASDTEFPISPIPAVQRGI